MKKKLAGLFVLILLAFVFLIIGITIINANDISFQASHTFCIVYHTS